MKVKVMNEAGYEEAMVGLSLNMDKSPADMHHVAKRLCSMDKGHNKFLEQLMVWVDVTAPRYFWSQFDTYRHCSKQSQSTMHTGLKRKLSVEDFEYGIVQQATLNSLNALIEEYPTLTDPEQKKDSLKYYKAMLPEGFLQRRVVMLNYKSIRNILAQRRRHKLPEWREFCETLYAQCTLPQYLEDLMK